MKVYTLTGKSGTGKSFQAINICKEKNIESIIDDGLFIYQNKVEAGISAKRQKTTVGAIKTAIFTSDEHAASVRKSIKAVSPASVLVIGTSDKMTDIIGEKLNLPKPTERIYIEDITTEEERKEADKQRHVQGKHVIPVPTLQLKRDFAGYFLDPMRIFKGRNVFGKVQYSEKTVVRPTFSYMGDFYISDSVLTDITQLVGEEIIGISKVIRVYENTAPDNLTMEIQVEARGSCDVWESAMELQKRVTETIESMTAFNVTRIDVEVRAIQW